MRPAKPLLIASSLILCLPIALSIAQAPPAGQTAPAPASPPAPAPAPVPATPSAPTLQVFSRETILDVTVTDAQGNPVHGLKESDFTLREDDTPQPLRSFHEYDGRPEQPLPQLPPNVYTNLQPPPASGAVNIILLDFVNAAPVVSVGVPGASDALARAADAQRQTKRGVEKYLQTMPPGTRVAVVGMAMPDKLRILQGFTSDRALLSAAVETMDLDISAMAGTFEQYCSQTNMRANMTLEAVDQLAVDLSAIKGKKNLIWFGVGIPPLIDPNTRLNCLPDYTPGRTEMFGLLTAAQIAVYPVDLRGLQTIPDALFGIGGRLFADIPSLPPQQKIEAQSAFQARTQKEQLSMEAVAEATGGAAFYNSNDTAALLGKAIDKGANYYTLSFVPPGNRSVPGRHTIKISLDQHPELHLVYRQRYGMVDPATKPKPALSLVSLPTSGPENMRAAMTRATPTSTQILFSVQVQPSTAAPAPGDPPVFGALDPKFKDKPLTRYSFQYAVPSRQIAFTSAPDGTRDGSVEVDVAAYDGKGALITSLGQSIKMPFSEDAYQQFLKGAFRHFQQLDLPSGALFLRIGVFDPTSNKVGTLEIPLTVPKK